MPANAHQSSGETRINEYSQFAPPAYTPRDKEKWARERNLPVFQTATTSGGASLRDVHDEGHEETSQNVQSTQYKASSLPGGRRLLSGESARSSSENNASLDQIRDSFCQTLKHYSNQDEAQAA